MPTEKNQVVPVFRMFDVDKAIEFYIGWLGFTIDWQHRFGENFPLYMQVSREGIVLHLTEHYGDCSPGAKAMIRVEDVEAWHRRISECDYRYYKPSVSIAMWNAKIMELTDPFGNKLIFNQPLD